MPSWDDLLTAPQVEQIRSNLISVARDAYAKQKAGVSSAPAPVLRDSHP
jgi:hypothetical protein